MRENSLTQRVILFVLLPLALLLGTSLWWVERAVRRNTLVEVRAEMTRREIFRQQEQSSHARQMLRALQTLSENAGLKAVLTLARDLEYSGALKSSAAQRELERTLAERLHVVQEMIQADYLAIINSRDRTLSRWERQADKVYTRQEIPINLGSENLGRLVVGRELNLVLLSGGAHAILVRAGKVERATLGAPLLEGISRDWEQPGEVVAGGERFLAMPMELKELTGGGRVVRLASVDAAVAPFVRTLREVLIPAGSVSLGLALILVWFALRAVTQPLRRLTAACQESIQKGSLEIPVTGRSGVLEVNVLGDSLHQAAVAASDARRRLRQAYLQILEALVESLEARDEYTAGHSRRVGQYSSWIGRQMGMSAAEIERVQIGATLHDIGKIGIPDAILLKVELLNAEEFQIIKTHPDIGVRILERIDAFQEYLGAVGLHHENHDGSGYPRGLRGHEIPLDARIVHVADAYDAMTSNRPYRQRMPEERVRRILREHSGSQFDPAVIDAFFASPIDSTASNLEKLNEALKANAASRDSHPVQQLPVARAGGPNWI